ncbi:MAG TPA: PIN domain-containing protein [Mycobacteriales bacterium]|nr:PIN domain-containing protein [Mycobacteriales bacterium]
MFVALLDTCVLWPSLQRDVLLSFAVEGIYRPIWSSATIDELEYHEARKLVERHGIEPDKARGRAADLIAAMRAAFDDAEIQGWDGLDGSYGLPDPDDEHVVAAAVVGGAGVIVTHNLRDFPRGRVPGSIDVQSPAEFAHHAVSVNPAAALRAVRMIAARTGRHGPAWDVAGLLDTLEARYRFTQAVGILRVVADGPAGWPPR